MQPASGLIPIKQVDGDVADAPVVRAAAARKPDDVPITNRLEVIDEVASDHSASSDHQGGLLRHLLPPSIDRDLPMNCLAHHRYIPILRYSCGVTEAQKLDLVAVFKALGHPTRLAILGWLKEPESFPPQDQPAVEVGVCLKHIQARADVSQSTASQFMATLQRAGLVTCTRIGQWSHYRRNDQAIEALSRELAMSV
jgi:ArsR family transcriptional regulator